MKCAYLTIGVIYDNVKMFITQTCAIDNWSFPNPASIITMCNTSLLLLIITLNNSNYNQEEEGLVPSTYIFIHTTKGWG